jgi:hypothetical protein
MCLAQQLTLLFAYSIPVVVDILAFIYLNTNTPFSHLIFFLSFSNNIAKLLQFLTGREH